MSGVGLVVKSDGDAGEDSVVEQGPGIVWADLVELACSRHEREHQFEPQRDAVGVLSQVIEPGLCAGQLCRQVALLGLEVGQGECFGQVGIEQSLLGGGEPLDVAACSSQVSGLPGGHGSQFSIGGSSGSFDIV